MSNQKQSGELSASNPNISSEAENAELNFVPPTNSIGVNKLQRLSTAPNKIPSQLILQLQSTIGNHKVQRLINQIRQNRAVAKTNSGFTSSSQAENQTVQRGFETETGESEDDEDGYRFGFEMQKQELNTCWASVAESISHHYGGKITFTHLISIYSKGWLAGRNLEDVLRNFTGNFSFKTNVISLELIAAQIDKKKPLVVIFGENKLMGHTVVINGYSTKGNGWVSVCDPNVGGNGVWITYAALCDGRIKNRQYSKWTETIYTDPPEEAISEDVESSSSGEGEGEMTEGQFRKWNKELKNDMGVSDSENEENMDF
jgi:hypothetical protein